VARPQIAPVGGAEEAGDDLALHVAFQEALFVFGEQLVTVEPVGQRREATPRYAGDDAYGFDQADLFAAGADDFRAVQILENAVGKGGRAGSAARKGEHDERVRFLEIGLSRGQAIAGARLDLGDGRIDRPGAQPATVSSAASTTAECRRSLLNVPNSGASERRGSRGFLKPIAESGSFAIAFSVRT